MPERKPADNVRADDGRRDVGRTDNGHTDENREDEDRKDEDRGESPRVESDRSDVDRRRSPRFSCSGLAKITRLPSSGIFLPGTIRDLSLGGCCVDTTLPIDFGVRTEIVVRVNAASFRAVSEVKAIRGDATACLEFIHLSAGGKDLLEDMVTELARLQAFVNKLRAARREMDAESFRRQLEVGRHQAVRFRERFPFLETILSAEISEQEQADSPDKDRIVAARPLVIPVDLFG